MKYNNKLSDYQLEKIIKHFCVDIEASKTALLTGFNRNTINHWYGIFRHEIYRYQSKRSLHGMFISWVGCCGASHARGIYLTAIFA